MIAWGGPALGTIAFPVPNSALSYPMDPDLENVIRQALADAEAAGKDYQGQTEETVRAVQRARGDMTASDALVAVNLVRRGYG